MPGQRAHRRARLGGGDARQRGDHDGAGLGLPPGVDDRAACRRRCSRRYHIQASGLIGSPTLPSTRSDDRSNSAGMSSPHFMNVRIAVGRGVEDRDAVLLDDLPEPALVRGVRRALVHHLRRAVGQRAVDDVAVPGDPADVGRAPVDVGLRLEVEHRVVGVRRLGQVAAGGVQDALRLPRRARRVEDEQRVLGVERLGRRARRTGGSTISCHQTSRPSVQATSCPGAPHDQHVLDRRRVADRLVDGLASAARACRAGTAPSAVITQLAPRRPGSAPRSASAEKPPKTTLCAAPIRAQASIATAGLGDHRQVDRDPVARADARARSARSPPGTPRAAGRRR